MSATVSTAFTQQYATEVKAAYQRGASLLRNTVRNRTVDGAERIYFPKLGKGAATTKARHADVVPMGLEHSRVYADMADYYAPEYIDDLDQAKVNWTIRSEYAFASAAALGRQTDQIIIDAMAATTNTTADATLTLDTVLSISERLNDRDVPADMMRYAVINPATLSELLAVTGATSADFTTQKLLTTGREAAFWMGFNWIVHTGLPSGVKGYFYHKPAVGHGINADVRTAVDRVPEKVAWLVNSWMSMGAVIVDVDGVEELTAA